MHIKGVEMITSIAFCLSYVWCLINLILFCEMDLQESFIKRMTICIINQLCIGAVCAKVLDAFDISINLRSMGIVYLVLGVILIWRGISKKKFYQFNLQKIEVYSCVVIAIWFGIVFVIVFTPDVSLNYINADPANHFYFAQNIMQTGKLGNMYFAALYNALFMEVLQPFISKFSLYKAFICADTLANLLNIFMFYCLACEFCRKKFTKLVLPFVCLIYFLGWPFYSYAVGGFVYFGWGVTLFAYAVWCIWKMENAEYKKEQISYILRAMIAGYCVLECYMLFVPILMLVIAGSIWLLYRNSIMKNLKMKLIVILCGIVFAIVCFKVVYIGFFSGNIENVFRSFQLQGGIHRELYNDFLYILPMILYVILSNIKKKQSDVILRTEIITVCYTIVMLGLCLLGYISSYYYYKTYYILWFFSWIICVKAIDDLYDKDKIILYSLGGSVFLAVLLGIIGIDNRYIFRDKLIVPTELTGNDNNVPFSIYGEVQQYLSKDKNDDDIQAMFEICQLVSEAMEINTSQLIFISESYYTGIWFNNFAGGSNIRVENNEDLIQVIDNTDKEYLVLHQNSEMYREAKDIIDDKLELIYENGYYGLYSNE